MSEDDPTATETTEGPVLRVVAGNVVREIEPGWPQDMTLIAEWVNGRTGWFVAVPEDDLPHALEELSHGGMIPVWPPSWRFVQRVENETIQDDGSDLVAALADRRHEVQAYLNQIGPALHPVERRKNGEQRTTTGMIDGQDGKGRDIAIPDKRHGILVKKKRFGSRLILPQKALTALFGAIHGDEVVIPRYEPYSGFLWLSKPLQDPPDPGYPSVRRTLRHNVRVDLPIRITSERIRVLWEIRGRAVLIGPLYDRGSYRRT